MSSLQSSDEENTEMLLQAIDNSMFMLDSDKKNIHIDSITKPSLRPCTAETGQHNLLRVTSEFQHYVAKQLMRIIESQLSEVPATSTTSKLTRGTGESGICLLRCSSGYLSIGEAQTDKPRLHAVSSRKRIPNNDNSSCTDDGESDQDARFIEAAVDADWILSKKAILGWENSSKGELIVVKNCENDQTSRTDSIGSKENTQSELTQRKNKVKMKKTKLNTSKNACKDNKSSCLNATKVNVPLIDQCKEDIKRAKKKEKRRKQRERLKLMKREHIKNNIDCSTHLSHKHKSKT